MKKEAATHLRTELERAERTSTKVYFCQTSGVGVMHAMRQPSVISCMGGG